MSGEGRWGQRRGRTRSEVVLGRGQEGVCVRTSTCVCVSVHCTIRVCVHQHVHTVCPWVQVCVRVCSHKPHPCVHGGAHVHVQDSERARLHVHTYVCVHACAQDATSPWCSRGNECVRAPTARTRVCACTCTHVCTAGAYVGVLRLGSVQGRCQRPWQRAGPRLCGQAWRSRGKTIWRVWARTARPVEEGPRWARWAGRRDPGPETGRPSGCVPGPEHPDTSRTSGINTPIAGSPAAVSRGRPCAGNIRTR